MSIDLWLILSFSLFCFIFMIVIRPLLGKAIEERRLSISKSFQQLHAQDAQIQETLSHTEESLRAAHEKAQIIGKKTQQLINIMKDEHKQKREIWAKNTQLMTKRLIRHMQKAQERQIARTALSQSLAEIEQDMCQSPQNQEHFLDGLLAQLDSQKSPLEKIRKARNGKDLSQ